MDNIRALLFDLSGVLFEGARVIPGAKDAIQQLRQTAVCMRFVTNTATADSQQIINKLRAFGIEIKPSELFSAPAAAKQYIVSHTLRPFCLIHPNIRHEFSDIPQNDPNCVLLGDAGNDLHYQNLNKAFALCKGGAPLIAIGKNKFFKDENGLQLDAGAFVHALEWASETQAVIMGKPGPEFFRQVVSSTGFQTHQCLMIGDDVHADVIAAQQAGLQGALVKTGKYTAEDERHCPPSTLVINSVAELPALI